MNNNIYLVVNQSRTEKNYNVESENGVQLSSYLTLKPYGSGRFGDQFVVTLYDQEAMVRYKPGDIVTAKLRFWVSHKIDGTHEQMVLLSEIKKINL